MPKTKRSLDSTRSRRQASKEALKQMQLYLDDDDEETYVIPDDDEDDKDVVLEDLIVKKKSGDEAVPEQPPKKKYKLSHRKSSDDRDVIVLKSISNSNYIPKEETLELECYVEELSDVQLEQRQKYEKEEEELEKKLSKLIAENNAEVIFKGEFNAAYQLDDMIGEIKSDSIENIGKSSVPYQLVKVMDPRLGILVGSAPKSPKVTATPTRVKTKIQVKSSLQPINYQDQTTATSKSVRPKRNVVSTPNTPIQTRTNSLPTGAKTQNSTPAKSIANTKTTKTPTTIQTRNNNIKVIQPVKRTTSSVLPLDKTKVVDLTNDDTHGDNREVAFNKIQGKTYPSLVVVARPHLRVQDLTTDRSKLDAKVKNVLLHPPTKFTEWLIQLGLIRSEQKCPVHSNTSLKLGMYSDVSKFPFSGGYVWISDCCPNRFVSVFNGSIFEGSSNPPSVILKLIYHWACQTNIQNVVQWVKVENIYVKGIYTWLRSVCTLANQTKLRQLGGPGCKIEIGVISLGTTSHDGSQRQVKVEVLGVLESNTKCIRLCAVEPIVENDRNLRKKFNRILEPITQWVHPASTIITDLTVDRPTLHQMGFKKVIQTTSLDYNSSNRTIMEYLRRIVPRMFQNTLSLLSRQIIQQFLDELVWREWFGTTAALAFDNIIAHLAEQTRVNSSQSLILKLNKIAINPFKYWSDKCANNAATTSSTSQSSLNVFSMSTTKTEIKRPNRNRKGNNNSGSSSSSSTPQSTMKPASPDLPEQMVPLENYYYGTIDSFDTAINKITLNMKCPLCKSSFDNNIQLQTHLFKHAHNVSEDAYLCRYCLTSVSTGNELLLHVNKTHPVDTKFENLFVCLICETQYKNPFMLGKHMSKEHSPNELPYECGSCSFRCSNHRQVIDHFYSKHDHGGAVQCPFCLKSTIVYASGRNVTQNIHYFVQHLQKHQKKQLARKCNKCTLWFVQKDLLKEHQQKLHISMRGRTDLVSYHTTRKALMVPKSKMDKNPCDAEIINFSSLYYDIPSGSICMECDKAIISSKHFPSFESCQNSNCQYSTCCASAMANHATKCKGLNVDIPKDALPFEMFCVCGHHDIDGNSMAKHLAVCEKKSAYPSESDAKSATVMHSMLDILGLVRKPEEATVSLDKVATTDEATTPIDETPEDAAVSPEEDTDSPEKIPSSDDKVSEDASSKTPEVDDDDDEILPSFKTKDVSDVEEKSETSESTEKAVEEEKETHDGHEVVSEEKESSNVPLNTVDVIENTEEEQKNDVNNEDPFSMSKENVDNLHEAALNDILSSSDNVTPMDVDLESVMSGIDAPMEIE